MRELLPAFQREVEYNPDTGIFTRSWEASRRTQRGEVIDYVRKCDGYVVGSICGKQYLMHKVAWLFATGVWPSHEIDHINRNPTDNRLRNLRAATRVQNSGNASLSPRNKSGVKGVFYDKHRRKYLASIGINNKAKHLGRFDTLEEAAAAYAKAAQEHFGEFVYLARAA